MKVQTADTSLADVANDKEREREAENKMAFQVGLSASVILISAVLEGFALRCLPQR